MLQNEMPPINLLSFFFSMFLKYIGLFEMKSVYLITMVFIFQGIIIGQTKDENWELKKSKKGIDVYTRLMEDSKFKEYKSICTVEATPNELVEILLDVENYYQWMANVKIAEVVAENGENEFYVYSEVEVPWPFDNRDQVTRSVVTRNDETGAITIQVSIVDGYVPEKKGKIRMPSGHGKWMFTPLEDGLTEVHHSFGGDPGGSIPSWVVNMFLVESPLKTMIGIQERLEE